MATPEKVHGRWACGFVKYEILQTISFWPKFLIPAGVFNSFLHYESAKEEKVLISRSLLIVLMCGIVMYIDVNIEELQD